MPSNRFAKPAACRSHSAGGTSVEGLGRPAGRAASLRQIHRRRIATLIDFSVSDGGRSDRDRDGLGPGVFTVAAVNGQAPVDDRRLFNGTLNRRRRTNNRKSAFTAARPIITHSDHRLYDKYRPARLLESREHNIDQLQNPQASVCIVKF